MNDLEIVAEVFKEEEGYRGEAHGIERP